MLQTALAERVLYIACGGSTMPIETPKILLEVQYYEAAQRYLRSLPPEHFMEATSQSTQRKITVESLDLVSAYRSDVQVFSELLVQYPLPRQKQPGQVVPDNMVVLCDKPIIADGSYNIPLQPAALFWVLEYVSKSNRRKDYDENMKKYEHDLKVPYYLLFAPDQQELTLYRLGKRKYNTVIPNADGRVAIDELDLEVGLLAKWVRFWYQGRLLPLPADLDRALTESNRKLYESNRMLDESIRKLDESNRKLDEMTRLAEAEKQSRESVEREVADLRAKLKDRKN